MARKGRRSSHEERIQAIQLLAQGYTKAQVANILQVTEATVYGWQKDYRKGGLAALSTKIASGRKRLLTDAQMLELRRSLRLNPRQLEFDFGLWTRKRVRELIKRIFGIDYSEQNVGRILKMLGFSPQRPVYQALQRDERKRREWMEETFPAIRERALREGAKIFFAGEAGCRNDHQSGTTWAPVGETPVVKFTAKRESIVSIRKCCERTFRWPTWRSSSAAPVMALRVRGLIRAGAAGPMRGGPRGWHSRAGTVPAPSR